MEQEAVQRRRDAGRAILLATGAAVLAAAVGLVVGRETAPAGAGGGQATCASVEESMRGVVEQPLATPSANSANAAYEEQLARSQRASVVANLILQNPGCFDPAVRAQAQTAKDQLAAGADARAFSDAVARAARCVDPDRWSSFC